MKKHSAEDYLDKLLDSVNGEEATLEELRRLKEAINIEEAMEALYDGKEDVLHDEFMDYFYSDEDVSFLDQKDEPKPKREMYSRRVTKSEAEFLMEFEAELAGDEYEDFVKGYDKNTGDIAGEDITYHGGDAELDAVVVSTKKTEPEVAEEIVEADKMPEISSDSMEANPFAELFSSEDAMAEMPIAEEPIENDLPQAQAMFGTADSFDLGGVDLGALLNEATGESVATESVADEIPLGEAVSNDVPVDDVFANLFGEESVGEVENIADLDHLFSSEGESSGTIDLGNLGEEDLLSLLSGDGELSDLGDMLSQSDSSEISMDGLDAFAAFAENEMAAQSETVNEDGDKKSKKKASKGGLLDKIKDLLFSDDDDDEVELKPSKAPSAGQLSDENADILAELDAEENAGKGKGGLFGKKKKDKGEDKKEKKEKKEKPKKEKKPKAPKKEKPKKEKKPKEVDNTPPLPRGPVIMIWVMVFSLLGLVYLGTNLIGYSSSVSEVKSYYNTGNYAEAYQELLGLSVKEKDMALYNQVATLATVDSELNAYKVFIDNEKYTEALDSLVCAAGRCELNEDSAEVYECLGQMEILKKEVMNELNNYDLTYEQALEMYHIKDREDYTIALYTKLKELGLE